MIPWLTFVAGLLIASLIWWAIASAYCSGYDDALDEVCDDLGKDEGGVG